MEITLPNIQDALQSEDVEGLLALGAPHDEYSREAQLIANALSGTAKTLSESDIENVMRLIWNKCFGPFSQQDMQKRGPAFERIARQLLRTATVKS